MTAPAPAGPASAWAQAPGGHRGGRQAVARARLPEGRQVHLLSAYDTDTGIVLEQCGRSSNSVLAMILPEYWQVSLDMVFPDAPALADLDQRNVQSTEFNFSPPGPERDQAIREAEWEIRLYPTLQALWASVPSRSSVTLDRID